MLPGKPDSVEADPRDVTDRNRNEKNVKNMVERGKEMEKEESRREGKVGRKKKEVSRVKESLGEWRFPLHASQLARFQMDG